MDKSILHKRTKFEIYNPDIDYFIKRINEGNYFSLIRFQIEWWMILQKGLSILGSDLPPIDKRDDDFFNKWGWASTKAWRENQKGNRLIDLNENIVADMIKVISQDKPNNFYLSVSDRANYYNKWPPPSAEGNWSYVSSFIRKIIPKNEIPLNSLIWRRAVISGSMEKFIKNIQNKRIIFVGPHYYLDLDKRAKLNDFKYIEIDLFKATFNLEDTLEKIEESYEKESIYMFAGGLAGAWLISKLHENYKDSFFIEFGRALDAFYYFDPKWSDYIGTKWMNVRPPTWIKKI